MIFDAEGLFSDGQSLAGAAGTTISTNTIDRGAVGIPQHATANWKYDDGKGTKIPLRAQIVEDVAGGTSVELQVRVSANADFSDPRTVLTTGAVPVANLKAGYNFNIDQVPLGVDDRYIRLEYVRVGTQTAGKITAGIVLATDAWYK